MTEKKESTMCCDGFCIAVTPAETGVTIKIEAEDPEKFKAKKKIIVGCSDSEEECSE